MGIFLYVKYIVMNISTAFFCQKDKSGVSK